MSESPIVPLSPPPARQPWYHSAAFFLFWSWNLIFLAFSLLGVMPNLLPEIVRSVRTGLIPPIYAISIVILVVIPIIAVVLGFTILRRAPGRLLALGYVIEGPLMMILLIRVFAIREGNLAVDVLLLCAAVGMLAFLWALLQPAEPRAVLGHLRLAGVSLLAALALYAALVLAFYIPPLAFFLARGIGETFSSIINSFRYSSIASLPPNLLLMVMGFVLFAYSGTLILGMPLFAPWLTLRIWGRIWRRQAAKSSILAVLAVLIPLVAGGLGLVNGMRQPQGQAYALVKTPPGSLAQAQGLLQHTPEIRAGLTNAYLASYRYLSANGELNHIRDLYHEAFNISAEVTWPLEQGLEGLLSPLLYQPFEPSTPETVAARQFAFQKDSAQAADLYQKVFDQRILIGEKDAIVTAVRSTYSGSQADAAWQAVDNRAVHLNRQEVNLTEHGDWAEVELYEVYQSHSFDRQEVVYYFSLPESAVITGVWLGSNADRSQRSVYQVAPRGAAQEVYQRNVNQRIDPALVEQIGPRQYRLRVFPIEPAHNSFATSSFGSELILGAEQHLWMTFRVLAANGAWPLPQLAELRNVYWDADTTRLVNGKPAPANQSTWLPANLAALTPTSPSAHRFTFPGGETVLAQPFSPGAARPLNRLAVVIDRSYSMAAQVEPLGQALRELQNTPNGGVDLYLSAADYRGEPATRVSLTDFNLAGTVFIGGQNAAELLAQFSNLRGGTAYSAIFILTDESGYRLDAPTVPVTPPDAPVWIIHLGGFPLGYDDSTLSAIQASGGGVAASVAEALQRLQARLNTTGGDAIDGYLWQSFAAGAALPAGLDAPPDAAFAPMAARRLVLDEMNLNRGTLNELPTLDRMHAIAVSNSIITPYSSMIVLVNDAQKRLLEQLSKNEDRFAREPEPVGTTQLATITGVPEPQEWLLLGLALLLLVYVYRSRKAAPAHR